MKFVRIWISYGWSFILLILWNLTSFIFSWINVHRNAIFTRRIALEHINCNYNTFFKLFLLKMSLSSLQFSLRNQFPTYNEMCRLFWVNVYKIQHFYELFLFVLALSFYLIQDRWNLLGFGLVLHGLSSFFYCELWLPPYFLESTYIEMQFLLDIVH